MRLNRIIPLLLSAIMIISAFPITVGAATEGYFTYTVSESKATITQVSHSASGTVNIPENLGGYPVAVIESRAFSNCSKITAVNFPDTLETIGAWAFYNCVNIKDIVIPDSVKTIDVSAFDHCTGLKSVEIGKGVSLIGNYAFAACRKLEKLTVDPENTVYHSSGNCIIKTSENLLTHGSVKSIIPDDGTVVGIASFAFTDSNMLTEITLPKSIKEIKGYAFSGCTSLKSIRVHCTSAKIDSTAFDPALETVYFFGTENEYTASSFPKALKDLNPEMHYMTETSDPISPTCTKTGSGRDSVCTKCGFNLPGEVIPALGHTPGEWITEVDPTDTVVGIRIKICSVCNEVAIREYLNNPGDPNRDGKKNVNDVTLMLKYIAKWDVELDEGAADVTGDGKINISDVTLLLKYIAKWDVELK